MEAEDIFCSVIAEDSQYEVRHHGRAVEGHRRGSVRQDAGQGHDAKEQAATDQPPMPITQFHGEPEDQIKEDFAVNRPADAEQGLQDASANVKGYEEQAF